jgi:hypothetical protein
MDIWGGTRRHGRSSRPGWRARALSTAVEVEGRRGTRRARRGQAFRSPRPTGRRRWNDPRCRGRPRAKPPWAAARTKEPVSMARARSRISQWASPVGRVKAAGTVIDLPPPRPGPCRGREPHVVADAHPEPASGVSRPRRRGRRVRRWPLSRAVSPFLPSLGGGRRRTCAACRRWRRSRRSGRSAPDGWRPCRRPPSSRLTRAEPIRSRRPVRRRQVAQAAHHGVVLQRPGSAAAAPGPSAGCW